MVLLRTESRFCDFHIHALGTTLCCLPYVIKYVKVLITVPTTHCGNPVNGDPPLIHLKIFTATPHSRHYLQERGKWRSEKFGNLLKNALLINKGFGI